MGCRAHRWPALLMCALLLVSGCAQTTLLRSPDFQRPDAPVRVLLMAPDVELSELTAGGLREPKADWTERAREHVTAALVRTLEGRRVKVVAYREPENPEQATADAELVKLHDIVGGTIIVHTFVPQLRLPTKEGKFDWSLGVEAARLGTRTGADYALFVLFRDTYASAGRVALMVGAALLGVAVPGGQQVGFASLVDLRTGNIVWFNRLVDPAGDLREREPATKAVAGLLASLPL